MQLSIEIAAGGWTARRTDCDGLAALVNGQEVFFALMAEPAAARIVETRRGGGGWEAWPDLFEPCTDPAFPRCWQLRAGVSLPD